MTTTWKIWLQNFRMYGERQTKWRWTSQNVRTFTLNIRLQSNMWLRVYCFIPRTISRYLHNISAAALLGIEIQKVRFPGFPAPRLAAVRWEWVVGMRWWITISSIYYIYLVSALIFSIHSAHDTVCLSCAISLPLFVENELSKIAQNGRLSPLFVLPHFAHFNLTELYFPATSSNAMY